jgi:hypothetical protein
MRFSSGSAANCALLRFAAVLPALFALAVAGCESNALSGAKLYPVKGKVLLPDGKPLQSGQVVFVGSKSMVTSSANIESDGGFAMKSSSNQGLPEGEYKIRIELGSTGTLKSKGSPPPVSGQFFDEDTSGLTATVTSDEAKNSFEFKLTPTKSETAAGERRGGK